MGERQVTREELQAALERVVASERAVEEANAKFDDYGDDVLRLAVYNADDEAMAAKLKSWAVFRAAAEAVLRIEAPGYETRSAYAEAAANGHSLDSVPWSRYRAAHMDGQRVGYLNALKQLGALAPKDQP